MGTAHKRPHRRRSFRAQRGGSSSSSSASSSSASSSTSPSSGPYNASFLGGAVASVCPPGVFCLSWGVLLFLLALFAALCLVLLKGSPATWLAGRGGDEVVVGVASFPAAALQQQPPPGPPSTWMQQIQTFPSYVMDVLRNPYAPPYKQPEGPVLLPPPVATSSQSLPPQWAQVGILTPLNGASKDNILPLMGSQLFSRRDKWQYYTISNQHNNVKLPVFVKNRSALSDQGVDQVYSGDTLMVEGYGEPFKATMYETETLRYMP